MSIINPNLNNLIDNALAQMKSLHFLTKTEEIKRLVNGAFNYDNVVDVITENDTLTTTVNSKYKKTDHPSTATFVSSHDKYQQTTTSAFIYKDNSWVPQKSNNLSETDIYSMNEFKDALQARGLTIDGDKMIMNDNLNEQPISLFEKAISALNENGALVINQQEGQYVFNLPDSTFNSPVQDVKTGGYLTPAQALRNYTRNNKIEFETIPSNDSGLVWNSNSYSDFLEFNSIINEHHLAKIDYAKIQDIRHGLDNYTKNEFMSGTNLKHDIEQSENENAIDWRVHVNGLIYEVHANKLTGDITGDASFVNAAIQSIKSKATSAFELPVSSTKLHSQDTIELTFNAIEPKGGVYYGGKTANIESNYQTTKANYRVIKSWVPQPDINQAILDIKNEIKNASQLQLIPHAFFTEMANNVELLSNRLTGNPKKAELNNELFTIHETLTSYIEEPELFEVNEIIDNVAKDKFEPVTTESKFIETRILDSNELNDIAGKDVENKESILIKAGLVVPALKSSNLTKNRLNEELAVVGGFAYPVKIESNNPILLGSANFGVSPNDYLKQAISEYANSKTLSTSQLDALSKSILKVARSFKGVYNGDINKLKIKLNKLKQHAFKPIVNNDKFQHIFGKPQPTPQPKQKRAKIPSII